MSGRILTLEADIQALVRSLRRVAVLGIKTQAQSASPAYSVPDYLQHVGLEIVPVPTYFPEVTEILGCAVFRKVADIPGDLDCVDVFRRPQDLAAHLPDLLAKKPRSVWLQLNIRDDAFARALAVAGIDVVQDRCLMVDHARYAR